MDTTYQHEHGCMVCTVFLPNVGISSKLHERKHHADRATVQSFERWREVLMSATANTVKTILEKAGLTKPHFGKRMPVSPAPVLAQSRDTYVGGSIPHPEAQALRMGTAGQRWTLCARSPQEVGEGGCARLAAVPCEARRASCL